MRDQRFAVLAPKIPLLRIIWPKFWYDEIEIFKINSSASYTYNKLLTGKKICLKDFWPLQLIQGAIAFSLVSQEKPFDS